MYNEKQKKTPVSRTITAPAHRGVRQLVADNQNGEAPGLIVPLVEYQYPVVRVGRFTGTNLEVQFVNNFNRGAVDFPLYNDTFFPVFRLVYSLSSVNMRHVHVPGKPRRWMGLQRDLSYAQDNPLYVARVVGNDDIHSLEYFKWLHNNRLIQIVGWKYHDGTHIYGFTGENRGIIP